ncbi:MAG: PhoH family protein [Lewinellaceae bacterium]|nr:PhoH family protein [Saprospiraceae bacterium]MCB9342164.1 PhoH family protein [Lewinellaceae bacterium]
MSETTIPATPSITSAAYSGAALEWLNSLPDPPSKADLSTLGDDFAIRAIHELLDGKLLELPIHANHPASDWLIHFYFEARNREKVFGTKNLGIGYPFVTGKIGGQDVAAPLFVWQISLEPNEKLPDNWTVQHTSSHAILPNYPFFHLVDAIHNTDYSKKAQELAENKKLSTDIFNAFCQTLSTRLSLEEEGLSLSIQPFQQGNGEAGNKMIWSAVAGIFPTLPKTTVTQPPTVVPDLSADSDPWGHSFPLLPLDPSQRSVMASIQKNALTVVEGASGSGKTYLISAIAMNALSNGKKCLVVSKSINALRRAQKFLLEKGVGELSFVLRDLEGDKLMLADMLRMSADSKSKPSFNPEMYKTLLNKTQREQNKLDKAWEGLHAPLFGEQSFSETVGRYLRANRSEGKELLLSLLNPQEFAFTKEEYDDIVNAIYASEPLFRRFPTLHHPLNSLNHDIFIENDAEKGLAWTQGQVKSLMNKATALHHKYISQINDYSEGLQDHFEQYYYDLASFVKRIRDGLEDGVTRFGPDFEKPISNSEKLYGVFSDKYKEIVAAKEKIGGIFDEMRRTYGLRRYFEFDFPASLDLKNIRRISELTKDFDSALRMWHRRIPSIVREDVRRLNAKSIHAELDFREKIKELEYSLDSYLEEFNESGLYQDELKHEMLTLPKRQEYLESIIARLEDTQFYLRDFDDFYIWQNHWLALEPAAQKAVQSLCKIKPDNWQKAFESWYLHHLLQKEFQPSLVWDEITQENLASYTRELNLVLPGQISSLWYERKMKALKSLKSSYSKDYKNWFGKDNRKLSAELKAEDLFQNHIEPLTETLPVLLTTPQVALDVMQLSKTVFDVVLVDEAHNIPKQECYHLFDMAKHLVVFGDARQDMTPFAEDDILEFCIGIGAQPQTLEYQHQDTPEGWVRFNKIAFGTPFQRIPSGRSALDSTVVVNVEGRFDEKTGTNEAEARQIIDWLNLIEQTPTHTYPVVGIACATVQQRDLIAAQLLRIRQKKLAGWEKIQQLYLNGLGVYQFAELQGQHVDVMLLSLTHGVTDANGSLTRDLHFWNSQLGFNQLHVVLTRATQKFYVAHSIPEGLHSVLASDKNFLGTCILSHLVTFADNLQRGEREAAEEQLSKMKLLLDYEDSYFEPTVFAEEVELALRPYFEQSQMRKSGLAAGVRTPLFIQGMRDEEPSSVVAFDGVMVSTKIPSYEWEEKLKNYFRKQGISYVPALSAHWWRSPKQEARKLASRLLTIGEE